MLFHRRIRFLLLSALLPVHLRSAVPLPVLPELRVTDKGLLDAALGIFLSY